MSSSYVAPPPGTRREGPVNPTPHDYRHLESDRALLHPPPGPPSSENMVGEPSETGPFEKRIPPLRTLGYAPYQYISVLCYL